MSFEDAVSSAVSLHPDALSSQQKCLSDAHDEVLFAVPHQTIEPRMKTDLQRWRFNPVDRVATGDTLSAETFQNAMENPAWDNATYLKKPRVT